MTIRTLLSVLFVAALFAFGTTGCVEEGGDDYAAETQSELAAPAGSCSCNSGGTRYGAPIAATNDCLLATKSAQCADVTCERPRLDNPAITKTFGCHWSSGTAFDGVEVIEELEGDAVESSLLD